MGSVALLSSPRASGMVSTLFIKGCINQVHVDIIGGEILGNMRPHEPVCRSRNVIGRC